MAKQCPVCGTRFPNFANVCDQHGVALRRVWPGYLPWLLLAGLCLLAAPFALRAWWLSQLSLEVVSAQLENSAKSAGEAADVNRWLANKNLHVRVRAHNDSRIPVTMQHAHYELFVFSVNAVSGEWRPDVPLHPGVTVEIFAVVPLTDPVVRGVLLNTPPEGVHVQVRAWLTLRIAGLTWLTPVERRLLVKPVLAL